jgi:uncharacterized cofD-like protein
MKKTIIKWFTPGIGVKRWLILLLFGVFAVTIGLLYGSIKLLGMEAVEATADDFQPGYVILLIGVGVVLMGTGFVRLAENILAPYRRNLRGHVIDAMYTHSKRQKGTRVVVIGGGTGLPSVLRGLKKYTDNITAIVTVADDGGSSGRLRRELGVLPPGDLRNNIAALADDESLMTQLFQYRFANGDLGGHAFGNLFISALAGVTGSLETALIETARVLNIQGRVLPATLEDVQLVASVRPKGATQSIRIEGESKISEVGGYVEHIDLMPENTAGYSESIQAILDADVIVIGPGSLYTSILPNLLVSDIADALRASNGYKIYVCNIATQPGETNDYSVAEHVMALEKHIGRGLFQVILANNAQPRLNAGKNTVYVQSAPPHHEILQRYEVRYTDLVDMDRPWRHDSRKLAAAILNLSVEERTGSSPPATLFASTS